MWKGLLALGLALVMMLGGGNIPARAAEEAAPRLQATELRLQAKSKKKKNQATATPAAKATAKPTATPTVAPTAKPTATPEPEGPIIEPQAIADYLFSHDMQLPDNFITKKEAQQLGWDSSYNYLSDVAPGKSIGGDRFGNYEGLLPTGKGITYKEADCYYTRGKRNGHRVVFSSEGRVWYTGDHYNSFQELFPSDSGE